MPRSTRRLAALLAVAVIAAMVVATLTSRAAAHRAAPPRRAALARPAPSPPVSIDVFVRTYAGDGGWLVYLLRSMEKNLAPSAYRFIHLVTDPGADADFVGGLVPLFPSLRIKLHAPVVERWMTSHNNGSYHAQMLSKLSGGDVATGADVVCYLDSDNLLSGPMDWDDFVRADGAVGVAPLPFADLPREREAWQPGCQAMTGLPCEMETMTGFPICYPVSLFADFTAHVLRRHNGTSLVGVLKSLPSWSEFTPLGAYLMATRPVGGAGGWYVKPQKHPQVEQAWSWGGFNATAVARWEKLLRERGRVGGEWC